MEHTCNYKHGLHELVGTTPKVASACSGQFIIVAGEEERIAFGQRPTICRIDAIDYMVIAGVGANEVVRP